MLNADLKISIQVTAISHSPRARRFALTVPLSHGCRVYFSQFNRDSFNMAGGELEFHSHIKFFVDL